MNSYGFAFEWAKLYARHGYEYLLINLPESEIDTLFDQCCAKVDSGGYFVFWHEMSTIPHLLIDLYFDEKYVQARKALHESQDTRVTFSNEAGYTMDGPASDYDSIDIVF